MGWPFLHEKIYQLIPFRISDIMDDEAKKKEICTNPVLKFTGDEACLEKELRVAFPRVKGLELEIENMIGKLVNES